MNVKISDRITGACYSHLLVREFFRKTNELAIGVDQLTDQQAGVDYGQRLRDWLADDNNHSNFQRLLATAAGERVKIGLELGTSSIFCACAVDGIELNPGSRRERLCLVPHCTDSEDRTVELVTHLYKFDQQKKAWVFERTVEHNERVIGALFGISAENIERCLSEKYAEIEDKLDAEIKHAKQEIERQLYTLFSGVVRQQEEILQLLQEAKQGLLSDETLAEKASELANGVSGAINVEILDWAMR